MFIKRLPVEFFCLIKLFEASVFSLHDLDVLVDEEVYEVSVSSATNLCDRLSQATLGDNGMKTQTGSTEPLKLSMSLFEISGRINTLIETISTLDTKTAVEAIEKGLVQILDSGACLHDIAPAIGSLPIEAGELVLAAIRGKAYTLLGLLQKAYIWRDERQYHWFMALSYDSPWYDKDMWEDPELVPLDWENNLQTICEVENVALASILREKALQENVVEGFDAKLLSLCIEYDSIKIFEFTRLKPVQLKDHLKLLARNGAVNLLKLYQTHTGVAHLHLEKYPFPSNLSTSVDGFKFLMKNGYNFLSMKRFVRKFCKGGQLDLLKYLQGVHSKLIPDEQDLGYAAERNFVDILDWGRQFGGKPNFFVGIICEKLLFNRHFDTFYWWININELIVNQETIKKIAELGALNVLQWVDNRQPAECDFQEAADSAARSRRFHILKWLYEKYEILPCIRSLCKATGEILDWVKSKSEASKDSQPIIGLNAYIILVDYGSSNFELLQWVSKNAPSSVFDWMHLEELSENVSSKEMMLWLYQELKICPSEMDWDWAYETDNLEEIKLAAKNYGVHPTEWDVKIAAERGYLDIIVWTHKAVYPNDPSCLSIKTLEAAISTGNLEIAEYLVNNVFPKAKIEVFTNRSIGADKHLIILKWAHEHGFSISQPKIEVIRAIWNEDIPALEWLFANSPAIEPVSGVKWTFLVRNDMHKSYRWLLEKYPKARNSKKLASDAHEAYLFGSLGVIKVLHEKKPSFLRLLVNKYANNKSNYHVNQWLFVNGYIF